MQRPAYMAGQPKIVSAGNGSDGANHNSDHATHVHKRCPSIETPYVFERKTLTIRALARICRLQ